MFLSPEMFIDVGTSVLGLFGLEGVIIAASIAASAAGTAMSIVSGEQQAKAANQAADTQEALAKREAQRIQKEENYKQEQMLKERQLTLGKIKRAYGKSGLTMAGTPLLDELETTQNMTMDMLMSQYNATERAKSVRYQGAAESSILRSQGQAARMQGYLGAGQSIMGGLSTFSSMKYPSGNGAKLNYGMTAKNNARNLNQSPYSTRSYT